MKVDYIHSPFTFLSFTRGSKSLFVKQNNLQLVDLNLHFLLRPMSFQNIIFFFQRKQGVKFWSITS